MKSSKIFLSPRLPKIRPDDLYRVYRRLRKRFGHQKWWPGDTPFEVMIGAILTQNTAWTNVEKAIRNLKKNRKLSFKAIRSISRARLARLIRPAGYYNIKSERLKNFVRFLEEECGGNLSKLRCQDATVLRNKLLGVKGIGPETADSILLYALDKTSFVIDAYTKRIFSRHHLAGSERDYHDWQAIFQAHLPRERRLYNDYHAQIVRLAKEHCRKEPRCESCPLRLGA